MCVFRSEYNEFLHYVFLSEIFSYYLGTFLTSTVNQLTNYNLHNMIIPIPLEKEERDKIVKYLDAEVEKIDGVIEEKSQQLKIIQNNKTSLIYEYVTGKKRVKEVM